LIIKKIKDICNRLRDKLGPEKESRISRKTLAEKAKQKSPLSAKKPNRPVNQSRRKARNAKIKQTSAMETEPSKKNHPARAEGSFAELEWKSSDFEMPAIEGKIRFHDLALPDPVMHAIADIGFQYCTPIQAEILPDTLKGRDATGKAQTGTGKTAAFLITAITHLLHNPLKGRRRYGTPRVLILAPTRELAMQIEEEAKQLSKHCFLNSMAVFGGMDYDQQKQKLTGGVVDIIVATPGRLLDFHHKHDLHLSKIEILVIDEADRMLDMGFIPDVTRIIHSTPPKAKRQTMLFSATLTPQVTRLAAQWTREPVVVEIEPEQITVDTVNQIVYIVTAEEKYALLYNVITKQKLEKVLVFCNRRDETRRLADLLRKYRINVAILSGEIPQKKRVRTLEEFKAGKIRVLVATDVAGRGIHIEGISHVINYCLPHDPENYVHRIGRTGRAGALGTSVSFACEEDSFYLPDIEEFIGQKLDCTIPDENWVKLPPKPKPRSQQRKKGLVSSTRRPSKKIPLKGKRNATSGPGRRKPDAG
jgi:ATP-dependent RNA helicase RhlB